MRLIYYIFKQSFWFYIMFCKPIFTWIHYNCRDLQIYEFY